MDASETKSKHRCNNGTVHCRHSRCIQLLKRRSFRQDFEGIFFIKVLSSFTGIIWWCSLWSCGFSCLRNERNYALTAEAMRLNSPLRLFRTLLHVIIKKRINQVSSATKLVPLENQLRGKFNERLFGFWLEAWGHKINLNNFIWMILKDRGHFEI